MAEDIPSTRELQLHINQLTDTMNAFLTRNDESLGKMTFAITSLTSSVQDSAVNSAVYHERQTATNREVELLGREVDKLVVALVETDRQINSMKSAIQRNSDSRKTASWVLGAVFVAVLTAQGAYYVANSTKMPTAIG